VRTILGGKDGSQVTVRINLFSFMMTETWRAHPVVKYIKDDWLAQPQNHEYVGRVLNPPALPQVAPSPPSPPSPYMQESTVTIEEVPGGDNDDVLDEMRAEMRRREAELPESDEDDEAEWEELRQSLQRRGMERTEDPLALATRLFGAARSRHAAQPCPGSS
jgi:hypothetical protein